MLMHLSSTLFYIPHICSNNERINISTLLLAL